MKASVIGVMGAGLLFFCGATHAAELQVLRAEAAGLRCQMEVPVGWSIDGNGAQSGDAAAARALIEAEKPEQWWNKRKRLSLKESKTVMDTPGRFWQQIKGAFLSGSNEETATTYIIGVKDGGTVCHVVMEIGSVEWLTSNSELIKAIGMSIKPTP